MNITGEIAVDAPREVVFDALKNAPFFASCVEGVRDLKALDATHYDAVIDTHVAYMRFSFKVSVELTRLSPPDEIDAKIAGTPLGVVGRLTATSSTKLTEAEGQTIVSYAIEATLTGKLGSLGQPVLRAKAKEMEKRFTERLRAAFTAQPTGATP